MIEFTDRHLPDAIRSHTPTLVMFCTDTCIPCKSMIPILETLAEQYEGLAVVGKINLSQNYDSAKFYQITSIPTFLLFQNDQVQAAYTGIQSGETLATMIADYIND